MWPLGMQILATTEKIILLFPRVSAAQPGTELVLSWHKLIVRRNVDGTRIKKVSGIFLKRRRKLTSWFAAIYVVLEM